MPISQSIRVHLSPLVRLCIEASGKADALPVIVTSLICSNPTSLNPRKHGSTLFLAPSLLSITSLLAVSTFRNRVEFRSGMVDEGEVFSKVKMSLGYPAFTVTRCITYTPESWHLCYHCYSRSAILRVTCGTAGSDRITTLESSF